MCILSSTWHGLVTVWRNNAWISGAYDYSIVILKCHQGLWIAMQSCMNKTIHLIYCLYEDSLKTSMVSHDIFANIHQAEMVSKLYQKASIEYR